MIAVVTFARSYVAEYAPHIIAAAVFVWAVAMLWAARVRDE